MFPLIGPLIGAGASILGGLFGQSNVQDTNATNAAIAQQNIQAQQATNAANIAEQEKINQENIANQQQFAQQGVQWRAADARAAGINPLAALGAQTASFSNVVAPQATAPQNTFKATADNSFGTGVAGAGQDLSRAISATRSPEEMAAAIEKTRQDLESGQLDNEIKKATLASAVTRLRSAQVGPGMPNASKDHNIVQVKPSANSDSVATFPGRDVEGAAWIDPWAKTQWAWEHEIKPMLGFNDVPSSTLDRHSPSGPARPDELWARNPLSGTYSKYPNPAYYWDKLKGSFRAF